MKFFQKRARKKEALALHARQMNPDEHDFAYDSGERQTATTLDGVRSDHMMRYEWAKSKISDHFGRSDLVGGDFFCGNGYGTMMLSDLGQVTGIDASSDAIDVAKEHYSKNGNAFEQGYFPFERTPNSYDFIVSLESVEHVPDAQQFITALASWLKPGGLLIASTPNEEVYAFDPAKTPHHVRHFTYADVLKIMDIAGLQPVEVIGQSRTRIKQPNGETDHDYKWCDPKEGRFLVYAFEKAAE